MIIRQHERCLFLTTPFALADSSPEELLEQFLSQLPILPIDTVSHFGNLNCALNQSSILQFRQMLRHRSLGYRQFLVNVPEVALLLPRQKLHYRNPCRMSQCLCKPRQLLLFLCVVFIHNLEICSQSYEQ